jgi:serine phosphatase RsbU (regulator of sigma subunit)
VLGVFPDTGYEGAETSLQAGDRLLLYTDGITEAPGADGEEFGEDRLAAALVRHRHLDAASLHTAIADEVVHFLDGRGYQDDATMLAVAVA